MHLCELDVERLHAFDGFLDSDLLGHSVGILRSDLGSVSIADARRSMVQGRPEDVSMCLAFDGTFVFCG